jgi:hypothetical protein
MPLPLRIATFNVENLFSRARALNLDDPKVGDDVLDKVSQLQAELRKQTYDKPKILKLYR